MNYSEFKKQAATSKYGDPLFINFGAGTQANKLLKDEDRYLEFLDNNYQNTTSDLTKQRIKDYFGRARNVRYNLHKKLDKMVDKANKYNGLVGGAAGLGGAGLTYAGLGLIPQLKKKHAVRLLAGLLVGVPTGITAAHLTGKSRFDKAWGKPVKG